MGAQFLQRARSSLSCIALIAAMAGTQAQATPFVGLSFSPTQIPLGGVATLTITLSDDINGGFTGGTIASFAYPAGLVNDASGVTNTCGGTAVATAGAGSMSLSGASLTPGAVCYVYVNITTSVAGSYVVTFPAGGMTASSGSNTNTFSASLNVVPPVMVTTTADSGPGSLRQAILDTYSACFSYTSVAFNIPGPGPHIIQPLTPLPGIACGMPIDAYTQPGASRNSTTTGANNASIQVGLDGSQCAGCNGLTVLANGAKISGFAIYNFGGAAIQLSASGNVFGNYIGTDAGGMSAFANAVGVNASSAVSFIGSPNAGDANLISGNRGAGVLINSGASVTISHNQIGGRRDGTAGMGNGSAGVFFSSANLTRSFVENNFVRYNAAQGVVVDATSLAPVVFTLNAIFGNGGIGIDLGNDGPTLNDQAAVPYDTDAGPNDLVNYPVVTSVTPSGTDTLVQGYVKSEPNSYVEVQLFDNASLPANTEGQIPLTSVFITLDANGYGTFSTTLFGYRAAYVSAAATTSTCADCTSTRRSSEYSPAVALVAPPSCYVEVTTPVTGDGVQFIMGSGTLTVPPSASATLYADCFSPNFATAWSWSTSQATQNISITTPAVGQSATYTVSLVTPAGAGTVTAVLQASPSGAPVCSITPTTPMPLSPTSTGVFNIASSCSPAATSFTWGGTTVLTGQGTPAASMQVNVPGNAGYGYTALMTPANSAGTGAEATRVIWISPAQPSPSSLAFATTGVGSQSAAQTVTVTNYSNYFTPYLTVMPSSQFTVVANKCPSPVPVQSSCTIDVAFAPTAVGAQAGTLTISFPFPGNPSYTIALSGTATGAPAASPTPSSLTFAARTVNTTSAAQTVTLANSGNLSLAIASITVSGDFAFTSNCPASLPAGASCTINVTFTPLAVGARSGTLTITDNAAGSPHTIALSGTGLSTTAPVADVSPRSLLFNTQPVGTDSAMQAITVTNSGTAPLTFGPVTITGEFTLATIASTASPPPCPVTLSPGQSCQMGVIFHPAGVNLRQGTLSITTNASASPTVVNLSGNGLAPQPPQLSMDAGLSFGDQPVGTRSAGSAFAIKNVSAFVANIAELSASGDFGVSDTCTTIAPGATCSPLVTFQPSAVGARMGTLTVRTLRDAEPYVVTLSGTGTDNRVPAVELSVTHIGFGNSLLGMPETSQVILKNVGLAPLIVGGIAASDDFFTDASCITTIAPGATCTVHVTFLPSIAGHHIGSVTIDSNAAGTPHRVELTGTGCYVPSPGRARFGVLLCGS